jgi:hypothetical protein
VVDDAAGRIGTHGPGVEPDFISGAMAPEFGEPSFSEYLGGEPLAACLTEFLGPTRRLGWVHLCAMRDEYDGAWHRDTGGSSNDGSIESELEVLGSFRRNFLKWHTALVDDPCLWVVPASHLRYRTEREQECLSVDRHGEIPGAVRIRLEAGQTVFWNGNAIHRGGKPEGMVRHPFACLCRRVGTRTAQSKYCASRRW